MDGNVITVYRQITLRYNIINSSPQGAPLIAPQQQSTNVRKGNPCFNAVTILIIYALSIFLIVFGTIHMNECPAQKKLPVFMVVLGAILLVPRLFNYIYDCKSVFSDEDEYHVPAGLILLNLLFLLAEFALFITLCVYAFSVDPTTKPEDRESLNYCNKDLYLGGYWVSISGLIFYGLAFCCACCVCLQSD